MTRFGNHWLLWLINSQICYLHTFFSLPKSLVQYIWLKAGGQFPNQTTTEQKINNSQQRLRILLQKMRFFWGLRDKTSQKFRKFFLFCPTSRRLVNSAHTLMPLSSDSWNISCFFCVILSALSSFTESSAIEMMLTGSQPLRSSSPPRPPTPLPVLLLCSSLPTCRK